MENNRITIPDEYAALRNDHRSRLDYLNKLNAGFITFTTAVITICLSLFMFVGSISNSNTELLEKIDKVDTEVAELDLLINQVPSLSAQPTQLPAAPTASAIPAHPTLSMSASQVNPTFSPATRKNQLSLLKENYEHQRTAANISVVALQFFQALIILTPVIYSKICFNHALENNVRMSLISDYLEKIDKNPHNLYKIRHGYYKKNNSRDKYGMPSEDKTFPYYFGSYGSLVNTHRVGDLGNMHRVISWISLFIGLVFGAIVYINCVYLSSSATFKSLLKALGYINIATVAASFAAHMVINSWSCRTAQNCQRKNLDFEGLKFKHWNRGLMLGISALYAGAAVILALKSSVLSFNNYELLAKSLISMTFVMFLILCMFQLPCYKVELIAAENKIIHNSNAIDYVFMSQIRRRIKPIHFKTPIIRPKFRNKNIKPE